MLTADPESTSNERVRCGEGRRTRTWTSKRSAALLRPDPSAAEVDTAASLKQQRIRDLERDLVEVRTVGLKAWGRAICTNGGKTGLARHKRCERGKSPVFGLHEREQGPCAPADWENEALLQAQA